MSLGFPGLADLNRRTIRAPVNPMDKSTVVSIYPREIRDTKVTLQPGVFIIPPGSYEKPSVLVVGPSSWWREIDAEQPLLEIPVGSATIADSIVNDYCNGLLMFTPDSKPGLFYVPGELTSIQVVKEYKGLLDKALNQQRNWYNGLIKLADVGWARTNGNPLAVDDNMRMAARELGKDKEWLKDYQAVELIRCIACGALKDPRYPVCRDCKAVTDPELAKKLNLTFAQ